MKAAKAGKGRLLQKFLGASPEDIQEIYERTVLSTLQPKFVLNIACAQHKTLVLLADGHIYEFPRGSLPRQIEVPPRAKGNFVKLMAGRLHFVALSNHLVWNVYSWGSSEATSELLGRPIRGDDGTVLHDVPCVVADISGRIIDVTCGSDFTICRKANGDLWAFGSEACRFGGASKSSSNYVARLSTSSSGDDNETSRATNTLRLDAKGSFALLFHSSVLEKDEAVNGLTSPRNKGDQQIATTDGTMRMNLADKSELPPCRDWFNPLSDEDERLLSHAEMARDKSFRLALEAIRLYRDEKDLKLKQVVLESRIEKQERNTETDAAAMLPFSRHLGIEIPPEFDSIPVSSYAGVGGETSKERERPGEATASSMSKSLRMSKKTLHMSKIKDTVRAERDKDMTRMAKDAAVCASRLSESVHLLNLMRSEMDQIETARRNVLEALRKTELAAFNWRIKALLLERSLLKLKRARRSVSEFRFRTGETRVFPVETWSSLTTAREEGSGEPRIWIEPSSSSSSSGEPHPSSNVGGTNVVWVTCKIDPDWGGKVSIISIVLEFSSPHFYDNHVRPLVLPSTPTENHGHEIGRENPSRSGLLVKVYERHSAPLAPASMNGDLLFPGSVLRSSVAGNNLTIPAQELWTESTRLWIKLLYHAIVETQNRGEDAFIYFGFVLNSQTQQDLGRDFVNELKQVSIVTESDAQVAERLAEEVNETGDFESSKRSLWDGLTLEMS